MMDALKLEGVHLMGTSLGGWVAAELAVRNATRLASLTLVCAVGIAAEGRSIDDVGLSVRSVNSLKNSNIRTLADLVQYHEDDLLKVKNVGEKALGEIAELLRREGLNFGMRLEEVEGQFHIVDAGTAPQTRPTEGDLE